MSLLFSTQVFAHSNACEVLFSFDSNSKTFLNLDEAAQVQTYLDDTVSSLNKMRGENGLINDTIWLETEKTGDITIQAIGPSTSPTNIAVDILVQTELIFRSNDETALKNLTHILSTLDHLNKHNESGLFFSWYSTAKDSAVTGQDISAIDNMHLAIALWTVKETLPDTPYAHIAEKLFDRMNFSMFYDQPTGLVHGNFSYKDGAWTVDKYDFANLGSEARIIYTVGWALGVFKGLSHEPDFVTRACEAIECEILKTDQGYLLRLWTGSAFQLFFPKIFGSEDRVSPALKQIYESHGNFMIAEGLRRGLSLPAAHSPSAIGRVVKNGQVFSVYNPNAGIIKVVSKDNIDIQDPNIAASMEITVTPHALLMAASSAPNTSKFLAALKEAESMESDGNRFYIKGFGWVDAIYVEGELAGKVVSAQVAVNVGVSALALMQIQSQDGTGPSGRALYNNTSTRKTLSTSYQTVDKKINKSKPK